MGLQYRAIRAAATVLLVAAAVGSGGMAGMTSALAADPGTITVSGTLTGSGDLPLGGIQMTITEEAPGDGGVAAVQVMTAPDGTFAADLYPWGTAAAPAKLTIAADAEFEVVGESCSQTWGVSLHDVSDVTFADAPPEPLTLVASQTLLGEVCGTTATPPSNGAGGSTGNLTPPPTDTLGAVRASQPDRLGPALALGFLVGLAVAGALLLRRPGARRRD